MSFKRLQTMQKKLRGNSTPDLRKVGLDELAQKFEEMEHQQFGKDGFEDGIARMAHVEQMLGLSELAQYTAVAPPKS